jgi:hypothetical protein
VVALAPTATIRGVFLSGDLVTPIAFAQISVGISALQRRAQMGGSRLVVFRSVRIAW